MHAYVHAHKTCTNVPYHTLYIIIHSCTLYLSVLLGQTTFMMLEKGLVTLESMTSQKKQGVGKCVLTPITTSQVLPVPFNNHTLQNMGIL